MLIIEFVEVCPFQSGHGRNSNRCIDQDAQNGFVSKTNDMGRVDGFQQTSSVFDSNLRCFAFKYLQARTPYGGSWIQNHDVAANQNVKEVPQSRQVQLLCCQRMRHRVEILTDVSWHDIGKLTVSIFAELQKPTNSMAIVLSGRSVSQSAINEFVTVHTSMCFTDR